MGNEISAAENSYNRRRDENEETTATTYAQYLTTPLLPVPPQSPSSSSSSLSVSTRRRRQQQQQLEQEQQQQEQQKHQQPPVVQQELQRQQLQQTNSAINNNNSNDINKQVQEEELLQAEDREEERQHKQQLVATAESGAPLVVPAVSSKSVAARTQQQQQQRTQQQNCRQPDCLVKKSSSKVGSSSIMRYNAVNDVGISEAATTFRSETVEESAVVASTQLIHLNAENNNNNNSSSSCNPDETSSLPSSTLSLEQQQQQPNNTTERVDHFFYEAAVGGRIHRSAIPFYTPGSTPSSSSSSHHHHHHHYGGAAEYNNYDDNDNRSSSFNDVPFLRGSVVGMIAVDGGVEQQQQQAQQGPCLCLERPFQTDLSHWDEPMNKEATAQAMDAVAKGVMHMSVVFFGPALIQLATQTAREQFCEEQKMEDGQSADICKESSYNWASSSSSSSETQSTHTVSVFGGFLRLHPSSVLTVASVAATLFTALILPLVGALLDRSRHRKTLGSLTAVLLVWINASQIFLSQNTWPFFWILHALSDVLYLTHSMIILAYLQNLTRHAQMMSVYNTKFSSLTFLAMIMYMITMIVYAKHSSAAATAGQQDNNEQQQQQNQQQQIDSILRTSRVAHIISATLGIVLLGYCWFFLFGKRGPRVKRRTSPPAANNTNENIFFESISDLRATLHCIRTQYPSLKGLLFTILWTPELGSGTYHSILVTLQKSLLNMGPAQIGVSTLLTLLFTLVGARISNFLCVRVHSLHSFRMNIVLFMVTMTAMALFLHGPEHVHRYYVLTCFLGIAFGWLAPTEKVLICTLTPLGHEAELMGLIVCVHNAAAWLPPLLFSAAVNTMGNNNNNHIDDTEAESHVSSLRWALISLVLLMGIGLLGATMGIGEYETAIAQAKRKMVLYPSVSTAAATPTSLAPLQQQQVKQHQDVDFIMDSWRMV